MKNTLLGGLSSLLLPLGFYSAGTTAGASYQRSYLSSSINASTEDLVHASTALPRDLVDLYGDELDIQSSHHVRELVIVDGAVAEADKSVLRRALKPGVQIVELNSSTAGLSQLINALDGHKNLAAIHIVSHAEAGAILLGSSRITPESIQKEVHAFAALKGAVREGGDLLFYGCDLAANKAGEELLDIISNKTALDVAASTNLTGNFALAGDWELEVKRGNIESTLAFSEKALADFSSVLVASNGTKNFTGWSGNGTAQLSTTDFRLTAKDGNGATPNVGIYTGGISYMLTGTGNTNHYLYLKADGTNTTAFELTALTAGEAPGLGGAFTNVRIVGLVQGGGTVNSSALTASGVDETFTFGGAQLTTFSGVKLTGFKLYFDCDGSCSANEQAFFEFRNFTIANAIDTPAAPTVTDARISIAGASGTSGAYKIGDTVTATWNNTAGGDNNPIVSGVTVDFSQFGGGAAVVATNSSNTWTATYTITAGAIDTTSRNVSVTATNTGGSDTTADSTNATVDNVAPTVTDGRISISGATGTSGAYKIGDTVTATWNNTAGGDNNSDTISSVTVNFTQFGGGAAVVATNSSGTWTATYAIVAGAIDNTNRNISVTATDNAGNTTATSDTTNATLDNIAPSVSSIVVSGTPGSGDTSMAFTANFSESVANVSTDDFTLVGTGSAAGSIASVSAASGSAINVNIVSISGTGTLKVNLNASTNVADDAGNTVAAYSSGSTHSVSILTAPDAPTIGTATAGDGQVDVTFTAPGSNGGSAITTYTATANPGGAFGTCAGPAACTATVTGLSNGTAYTFTVTATNAIGTSVASGASNSATPKGNQTITFNNPGAQNFGTAPTLSGTATSSLAVTFSSTTTGVCTITGGGALTFVTAGTCTIDADQAGNGSWNAATTVTRSFTVNAIVPNAPTIGTATAGDTQASVTFTAPANTGGAAITGYTVTSNPGGITAGGNGFTTSPITVTGLTNGVSYTFTVTATNSAGTGSASGASNSITPAAPQTITFNNPGAQNFGTTPTLTATSSAGGGYAVSFTTATAGVCTITTGGALTFVTAGSCTINANQAGDGSYLAASQVSQTFAVDPVSPGVPTAATATAGDTQASIAFTAPVFTGGATITGYTVTSNPGGNFNTGAGSPIVVTGLTNGVDYTFTVTATNSAGTGSASAASNSVAPAAAQTITFANPGAQNFGTAPTLTATADSGLTPVFTSSTPAVCTITGVGALTFVTAGTCTINADQAGNASYLPATQVIRSFTVNAVVPGAPTAATASAGNAQASVSFTAPVFTGGVAITSYTVTANPGGATVNGAGSPVTFTGLTNGTSYTFSVTATNAAGTGGASAATNAVAPKGTQTISFTAPADQIVGTPLTAAASASSGLEPVFSSTTAAVCTVTSGGVVTLVAAGTCTLTANQAGNTSYLAAPAVSRSFTVNPVPNSAPEIAQGTSTSVTMSEEGSPVAFALTLTAADADSDPLAWSITSTAAHGAASVVGGAVSYVPEQNYQGTDSFVVQVSDAEDSDSIIVNVAVQAVNDEPEISGAPIASVNEGELYSFAPAATDVDVGNVLTFSILNKPTWASFDTATGILAGTPVNTDVGVAGGITISVSDGTASVSLPAFDLEVVNVNEAPVISGVPATSLVEGSAYSFIPTASDADADVLTFSITNKPTWASFNTATGALTGTPGNADAGISGGIVISVNDGTISASLPAFDIEVISTIDPLQPIVTAPADLELNATALFTPVSLRQLLGLAGNATQAQIEQILAAMASDGVSGNNCCTTNPEGLNSSNTLLLPPGRHQVKWKATNAVGVSGEAIQVVSITPLVSLSKSQLAVRGSEVEFRVLLNGPSPVYPFSVPYVINTAETTATATEHNLVNGIATFTQAGQLEVAIPVILPAVTGFSDSVLVVALGNGINAGAARQHVIQIRQGNIPPVVSLGISQGGVNTSLVTPNGGPVTVSALVNDANVLDTHTFDWSAISGLADTDGNPTNATRSFDPTGVTGGHQVQVTVTDSAGASVQAQVYFRVVASLPVLDTNTDTDQDGINDELEGAGDTDNNGIPDYLDNMPSSNILPQQGNTTNSYLIECDPGVRCGLGLFARGSSSGGVQVLDSELGSLDDLIIDPAFEPVGSIFDFTISDLPTPGQSVRVVIPQQAPVPANAVYRKFQNGQWVNFVSDADNAIHSAAGNPGYCPPPGTADWATGLTAGHLCVQLTLEDGGPNDDDGLVNATIVDPGAVSEARVVEPPPPPPKPPVQVNSKGGGSTPMLWLLVLGGLVLIRRAAPARGVALLLALLSINSQAAALDNTYLRLDVYNISGSQSEADFNNALTNAGHGFTLNRYEEERSGYQLAVGYQWSELTYSEVGYLDLGDVEVGLTLDGDTDLDAFASDFADNYPVTATGATLVQGLSFKAGSAITLSAEAGAFIWKGEVELDNAGFSLQEDDGVDPLIGARIDVALVEGFSLGLSGRQIFFNDQDVDLLSVSGVFRF